ncbi:MAG TPA: glycosyltransferase family 2 protein [Candidatus Acidoferrales bacterium]|nr:glycosyltransferase family 2 protein [Candidatus Acidoferrales bacterium]
MDKVAIVIPVYTGWNETKTCLEALRASTYRALEAIVVYHGTEEEINDLQRQYPEARYVFGSPALWWAGATNLGIRAALREGARYIMLLNHDCYVDRDTIGRLLSHARQAGDAIVAPIQKDFLTRRVTAVTAGTCFVLGFPTLVFSWKEEDLQTPKLLPTRLILGGRGALIPASVFERVGLFDERNLPSYYSDHDFYLRCRRRGIPLFVASDCAVWIDRTRTTLAADPGGLNLREFLATLHVPRSHRNLRDLTVLFRLHHPIRPLYPTGVALNLLRYCVIYACRRLHRRLTSING